MHLHVLSLPITLPPFFCFLLHVVLTSGVPRGRGIAARGRGAGREAGGPARDAEAAQGKVDAPGLGGRVVVVGGQAKTQPPPPPRPPPTP